MQTYCCHRLSSDKKKSQIFKAVFENRVTPLTFSFFDLVFSKRREWVLREIAEEFFEKYRELKGIEIIEITTAVEISDELKEKYPRPVSAFKEVSG